METWKPVGPPRPRPSEYAERVINGGDFKYSALDARRAFLAGNRDQRDRIAKIWQTVAARLEPARYQRTIAILDKFMKDFPGVSRDRLPLGGMSQFDVESIRPSMAELRPLGRMSPERREELERLAKG